MAFGEIPGHPSPHRTPTGGSESLSRLPPRASGRALSAGKRNASWGVPPPLPQEGGPRQSLGAWLAGTAAF